MISKEAFCSHVTRHTSHIAGLLRLAIHDDLTVMLPFTAVFPNAAILHKIEES